MSEGSFEDSWSLCKGKFIDLHMAFQPIIMKNVANIFFLFFAVKEIDLVIFLTVIERLTSLSIIASWIIITVICVNLVKPEHEKT